MPLTNPPLCVFLGILAAAIGLALLWYIVGPVNPAAPPTVNTPPTINLASKDWGIMHRLQNMFRGFRKQGHVESNGA